MTWTQPVCEARYREMYPGREPYRFKGDAEPCCFCGTPTDIYVRIDPSTVPFPREDDK